MKKYLNLSLILISSLLFSACSLNKNVPAESNISDLTDTNSSFSLRQLIAQNVPQKCTYTGTNQEGSFQSEIIINGQKFKQTLTINTGVGQEILNTISDGEYIYTWGDHVTGESFATKFKADFANSSDDQADDASLTDGDMLESQLDLDTDYQGECSPTTISDSDFQPPTNIEFEDYSKFLDDIKSSIPEIDITDLE